MWNREIYELKQVPNYTCVISWYLSWQRIHNSQLCEAQFNQIWERKSNGRQKFPLHHAVMWSCPYLVCCTPGQLGSRRHLASTHERSCCVSILITCLALAASRLLQAGLTNIHKPTETSCRWLASQTDRQTKMAMNSCLKWEPAQANVYYYIIVKYRFHFTTHSPKIFFCSQKNFYTLNLSFLFN